MMIRSTPDPLTKACEAFATWRASRTRGTRIPDQLWDLAVELIAEHGVATIRSRLKLNAEQFDRRIDAARHSQIETQVPPLSPAFLEVPSAWLRPVHTDAARGPGLTPPATALTATLERPDGARLRIDVVSERPTLDLLLAAFLHG